MATESTLENQPDDLNAIKALVKEFMSRAQNIDNEIEQLKEDRKELVDEYSDRLDAKTLKAALAVLKIQAGVKHRDTFDAYVEALTDPAQ
jgi:uncharacterized protein (UPF0335 family)